MPHRSNGKHRFPISEPKSRLPEDSASENQWLTKMEESLSEAHEVFVEKATNFIRQRPGVSLVIAAAVGGLLGWLIKRRD